MGVVVCDPEGRECAGPQRNQGQAAQELPKVRRCLLDEFLSLRPLEIELASPVGVLDRHQLSAPGEIGRDEAVGVGQVQRRAKARHVPVESAIGSSFASMAAASGRHLAQPVAPSLHMRRLQLRKLDGGQSLVVENVVPEPGFDIVRRSRGLDRTQIFNVLGADLPHRGGAGAAAAVKVIEPGQSQLVSGIETHVAQRVGQLPEDLERLLASRAVASSRQPRPLALAAHPPKTQVAALRDPLPVGVAARLELLARRHGVQSDGHRGV